MSYLRRVRASAFQFCFPGRQVIRKLNRESVSDHRAYLRVSYLLVIKYSRALWSNKIRIYKGSPSSSTRHYSSARTIASISLSWISQLYSAGFMVFKKYTIGCHYQSVSLNYKRIPTTTPSDTSSSSIVYRRGSQWLRTNAVISRVFSSSKAIRESWSKRKGTSFLVKRVSGFTMRPYSRINRRQKLQNPRKDYTPFTIVGAYQAQITLTFSGSTSIPSVLIINLRYFVRFTLNSLFLISTYSPASRSRRRTFRTYSACSNSFSKQIRISSRQAIQNLLDSQVYYYLI